MGRFFSQVKDLIGFERVYLVFTEFLAGLPSFTGFSNGPSAILAGVEECGASGFRTASNPRGV